MQKTNNLQDILFRQVVYPIFYNYKWRITLKNCESLCLQSKMAAE